MSEQPGIVYRPDLPAGEGATYSVSPVGEQPADAARGEEVTIAMTLYRKLGTQREKVTTPGRARVGSAIELLLNLLPGDAWEMGYEGDAVTVITIDWSKVPAGIRDPRLAGRRII
jgi:hypothetical protein